MPRATRAALGTTSDSERTVTRLVALAYILLGAGFFLSGIMQWRRAGQRALAADVTIPGRLAPDDAGLGSAYSVSRPGGGGDLGESLTDADRRTRGALRTVKPVTVHTIEQRVELIRRQIVKDAEHPDIIAAARGVLTRKCGDQWCVAPKDYEGEAIAMFNAVVDPRSPIAVRYTRDHPVVDVFTAPNKTMKLRGEDCLPGEALLQTPSGFKPIADIRPGDVIMGDGAWTRVTRWWDKGVLPVCRLELNTGSVLRCTAQHRLFVVPQTSKVIDGVQRRLPRNRVDAYEAEAGEVEEGDHLLTGGVHPAGEFSYPSDLAWLLGVFVADGWVVYDEHRGDAPNRVGIAGKDGHPKEEQKRRVQQIATAQGWKATWHSRYITVWPSSEWMELFLACGRGAPNKHFPTTNVTAETAVALLAGVSADGCRHKGGLVYSTTSAVLALQIRVLHRMLAERVNIRRADEHGGLGTHPIYRVSLIRNGTSRGAVAQQVFAVVKGVSSETEDAHVYDIETERHRFYLPEHDIVVHNCDGLCAYLGALLVSVGHSPELVTIQAKGAGDWSHIFIRVPRDGGDGVRMVKGAYKDPGAYLVLDPSMPEKAAGWEPPGLTEVLRHGGSAGIVEKARVWKVLNR